MDNEAFRLIMVRGPQPDKVFTLGKDIIAIGRDTLNDVVINDPEVSRQHARMVYENGAYIIEDLGSTNGSFVNGARITGPCALSDNDEVGFGETVVLTYKASVAAATETIVSPGADMEDFAPPPPPPPAEEADPFAEPPPPAEPELEPPFAAPPPEPDAVPPPFEAPAPEPDFAPPLEAEAPEPEFEAPPPPFPDDSLMQDPVAPPPPFEAEPPTAPEPEPFAEPPSFDAGFPAEPVEEAAPPPFDAGPPEQPFSAPPPPMQDAPPPPASTPPAPPPSRPPTTATPVTPSAAAPVGEKPSSRRNLLIGCGCLLLLVICAFVVGFGYLLWNAPTSFFDDPIGNFGDLFGGIILPLSYLF